MGRIIICVWWFLVFTLIIGPWATIFLTMLLVIIIQWWLHN